MRVEKKEKILAGIITFAVAVGLLLFCYFSTFGPDKASLAAASIPETGNEEEIFLEPDLLLEEQLATQNSEQGESNAENEEHSPSAPYSGEPEKAEVDNIKKSEPGKNPNPSAPVDRLIAQQKPSNLKHPESSAEEKERQKASSRTAQAFAIRNGVQNGRNDGKGISQGHAAGVNISGNLNGRKFLGCNKFNPELEKTVTVKVSVVVNAAGAVVSAQISGKTSASEAVRRQCVEAAKTARWEKSPGSADQRGILTFTLTPR